MVLDMADAVSRICLNMNFKEIRTDKHENL